MMTSNLKQSNSNMFWTKCDDETYPKHVGNILISNTESDTKMRTTCECVNSKEMRLECRENERMSENTLKFTQNIDSSTMVEEKILNSEQCIKFDARDNCYEKLMATIAENLRLRQLLKDVTEVNKRWQKYNQDRQDYVQQLLLTIEELELKLHNQSKNLSLNNVKRHLLLSARHSDSALLDPSGELSMLRKAHNVCIKENVVLQKKNEEIRLNYEELVVRHQMLLNQVHDKEKQWLQDFHPKRPVSPDRNDSNVELNLEANKVYSNDQFNIKSTKSEFLQGDDPTACIIHGVKSTSLEDIPNIICPACKATFQTSKYAEFLLHFENCIARTTCGIESESKIS